MAEGESGSRGLWICRSVEMPLRLTNATLMSDIETEWTLNAPLTRFSSYRKCSKRRILGHSAQATSLPPIEGTTKCSRIARGFGCGSSTGFAAEVKPKAGFGFGASAASRYQQFISCTNPSAATSRHTWGTGLKSIGAGTLDTPLPYRTCSTYARRSNTSGLPCEATNHIWGSGCVGRSRRGISPDRVHDQ